MWQETVQQQRDRWNWTEAWRFGLLIYITRVFLWNRNTRPPLRLDFFARLILEHVHSCRHTAIVQKQALLPMFFAGCETKDQFSRQSIRDYCQYWSQMCGHNLFSSASSLLEDVWLEWGSVIDKKQQPYQFPCGSNAILFWLIPHENNGPAWIAFMDLNVIGWSDHMSSETTT